MMNQYDKKGKDRRHKSAIMPLIYLLVELVLIGILCFIVFQFDILIVNVLVVIGAIYFFITSSWKRYRKVRARQKYYKE
ncbi:hypothetical protein [Sulfurovum mangrovi]|uniref:hypothetical protein n=1 Tax=Sulfurovum mangrovi TaxID=2893889 RepID=UPI001E627C12|nr:hypothetical protein [Sulfurovum mangrovi]UFH59534.1 hypothetical protein LN246_01475 [Sulfurovum mangrovi]UFH60679.1 hypothetical protein LN246_14020 [Sulfurovum mangrovi]